MVLAGAVGCNIGSAIAYWIGAKGGRPLVERYGNWVLMSNHDLDRMTGFFERYGSIAILVGRMLPIVQTFVAFPAGHREDAAATLSHLHHDRLSGLVLLPGLIGRKLGEAWDTDPRFQEWFHRFHLVVELALLAGLCGLSGTI